MKHKGVEGGTTSASGSLCRSCRNAHIIKGIAESSETIFCLAGREKRVPPVITECNMYDNKSLPSLWSMEKIAWVLVSDKKSGTAGFVTAKEHKKIRSDNGEDLIPEEDPFRGFR